MEFWYGNRVRRARFWGLFDMFRFRFVDFLGFGTEFWLGEGYPVPEKSDFLSEMTRFSGQIRVLRPKKPPKEQKSGPK